MLPLSADVSAQAGGLIELTVSDLHEAEEVHVVVYRTGNGRVGLYQDMAGLSENESSRSAEEIDAYVRTLRDEWDR
jgi:hypothetical protein